MDKIELYDSLDAPISVWEKVHKSGDLSHLIIGKTDTINEAHTQLEAAWEKLYNEYIEEFGLSDQFVSIKKKEIEIALLKCKLIQTEDRAIETEIEIAELELGDINTGVLWTGLRDAKIAIEKNMGFQINMNTTSIRDFYNYLKDIQE